MRILASSAFAILLAGCPTVRADDQKSEKPKNGDNFPGMIEAIKATPGCLGVDTAKTASGKSVIFAWFENKKAVMKWYTSETHQELMKYMDRVSKPGRKPLADVPDDSGPLMVVASITLEGKPTKDKPIPFKQIAIEIYQPLGAGISVGGKFAPEKMVIPPPRKKN